MSWPDIWIRLPRHKWPKSRSNIEGPLVLLDIHLQASCGRDSSKKFYWDLDGKSTELRMSVCSSKTRIILVGIRGWHQNDMKKAEYGSHVEEFDETCGSCTTNIISGPRVLGMHST